MKNNEKHVIEYLLTGLPHVLFESPPNSMDTAPVFRLLDAQSVPVLRYV